MDRYTLGCGPNDRWSFHVVMEEAKRYSKANNIPLIGVFSIGMRGFLNLEDVTPKPKRIGGISSSEWKAFEEWKTSRNVSKVEEA